MSNLSENPILPAANTVRTQNKSRLLRLKSRRKLWLKVHLWLGLGLGVFLALIGLTGSVLVFWHEIDEALNPKLYRAQEISGAPQKTLHAIVAAAREHAPPGWESAYFDAPEDAGANYVFHFYYAQSSPPPEAAESLNIAIDPYTAHETARRVFYHAWNPLKHSFVGFFFKLHYALLLGATGGTLVGILAVFFIVSVLAGVILWWPLDGKWRRVLTIKRKSSSARFNHDLHQAAGFYSLVVLLTLLVSGIYFNLYEQFRWLVELFSPLTPEFSSPAQGQEKAELADLDAAIREARRLFPGGKPYFYSFPNSATGTFTACYQEVADLRGYVLDNRCLVMDRESGNLVQVQDAAHGSGGDVFMQWQWPLHSGRAFGWTGRILVCIAGLLCPLLFITGVIRWLQKRRAKQLHRHGAVSR